MANWTVTGVEGDRILTGEGQEFSRQFLEMSNRAEAKDILRQVDRFVAGPTGVSGGGGAGGMGGGPQTGGGVGAGGNVVRPPAAPIKPPPMAVTPSAPQATERAAPRRAPGISPSTIVRPATAPQTVMMPGAMTRQFRETTPQTKAELDKLFEQQDTLAEVQRENFERQAIRKREMADTVQRQADIDQMNAMRQRGLDKRKAADYAERMRKLDDAVRQSNELKIEDFWAQRGTANKIFAGLGVALGAMGAALSGGPNTALQIVQGAIQDDLERQKANIAHGRVRIENLRGALAQAAQVYDDEQSQLNAAKVASYEYAQNMLRKQAALADSEQAQLAGQELMQQLEVEKQKARVALQESQAAQVHEQYVTKVIPGRPAVTAGQLVRQQMGFEDYDRKLYVKEAGGNARDVTDAKRITQAYGINREVRGLIGAMRALRKKVGKELFSGTTEYKRMEGLAQSLSVKLAVQNNLGAISESDRDIIEGMSGGNVAQLTNFAYENINDLEQLVGRSERVLQSQTNPVHPNQIPALFRKMQMHPWGEVLQAPTASAAAQSDLEAGV